MSSLAERYAKWDQFEELDDDNNKIHDLNAITGPPEEVAAIRKNWGLTSETKTVRNTTKATPQPEVVNKPLQLEDNEAPAEVIEGGTKKQPNTYFDRWNNYDAEAECLSLDNDGKAEPDEAPQLLKASNGRIDVEAVNYKQDRDEWEIDQDFEKASSDLKIRMSRCFRGAFSMKEEGNTALKLGNIKTAGNKYTEGISLIQSCLNAITLMSSSMADKIKDLAANLHANYSLVQIKLQNYPSALSHADSALEQIPSHEKALYRRGLAAYHTADYKTALDSLKRCSAGNTAAEKLRKDVMVKCAA